MASGIYKIKCLINNKCYIGYAKDLSNRFSVHLYKLRNGINTRLLQEDYDKFGENNFVFKIIEYCNIDKLEEREKYYIKNFQGEIYNITEVTEDLSKYKCNEETKRKISKANSGKPKWNSGKTGVYSDETLNKMSKLKVLTEENLFQIKDMILSGNSLTEISKKFNVSVATISNIKNGKNKKYAEILNGGISEWGKEE